MRINSEINKTLIVFLLLLSLLSGRKGFAQISGSLFMLPNNFYSQMNNPSYMRTDNAIEFSVAGLAGFSFINQGSFKISDLITTPGGSPVIDIENFYQNIPENNFIIQDIAVPMAFVSIPHKSGTYSFYYRENVNSVLKFKKDLIEFLVNGNIEPEYKNFNSNSIKILTNGYREFTFGYARKVNKKLDAGLHAKLLYGAAFVDADEWNYGIETANDASFVNFLSNGYGHIRLPITIELRNDSTIQSVDGEKAFSKYMKSYDNKGFALDLGINYRINKRSSFSAAVRDLGAIWYNSNGYNMEQNDKYGYIGFDMINAIRWPEEAGYTNPNVLIDYLKDSIRNAWQPVFYESSFISALAAKSVLHYQYLFSDLLKFGITNQSVFQKNNFQNILTFSALQSWPNLSVFESLNLHGTDDVSLGGGIQYEGDFFQAFLATDNLIAFYHPANNKTFSLTAGICILLNHAKWVDPEKSSKGMKKRKGKISPHLPYYKHLRELKN
jgi:hypothetical protein